jgi:NtrC-family two-component system response regulator AlgB
VGRFREDLFFRLNVVAIALPPLRERASDIPVLADRLLAGLCVRHRRTGLELAPDARAVLLAYRWPGNVRELVNVLERAVVLSQGRLIRTDDLPDRLLAPVDAAPAGELSLEQLERRHIQQVLADAATLEEAAARLGINPTTLWRKRKRYGIE